MAEKMKYVYGIDLGTTYSCIARVEGNGIPTVIKNKEGTNTTPSVVNIKGDEVIVGQVAKDTAILEPENTIALVKTLMGKTQEALVQNGHSYSPAEISGLILKKVAGDATALANDEVKDVVITVPAYFGDAERHETKLAGEYAGLNVLGIISEPVAAAICYGITREQTEKNIMIYDLGGGTFDVTIMHIKDGQIEVICAEGNHTLGGRNWDETVVNYFKDAFREDTGFDGEFDPEDEQDLLQKAEKVKIQLSAKESVPVPLMYQGEKTRLEFTRDKFDEITSTHLQTTIDITDIAIEIAAKKEIQVDDILLVGGSTKMPQVSKILTEKYNIIPQIFDPDEAVAKGAAIYALDKYDDLLNSGVETLPEGKNGEDIYTLPEVIGSDGTKKKTTIIFSTTKSFGLQVLENQTTLKCRNMIIKNTQMPDGIVSVTKEFYTSSAGQTQVELVVYESDIMDTVYDINPEYELGKASMDLPSGLPDGTPVEVTFELDNEGNLNVSGKYDETHSCSVKFERHEALSSGQIAEKKENFNKLTMKD